MLARFDAVRAHLPCPGRDPAWLERYSRATTMCGRGNRLGRCCLRKESSRVMFSAPSPIRRRFSFRLSCRAPRRTGLQAETMVRYMDVALQARGQIAGMTIWDLYAESLHFGEQVLRRGRHALQRHRARVYRRTRIFEMMQACTEGAGECNPGRHGGCFRRRMFMLSVENEHPLYVEACHRLRPGQSAYSIEPNQFRSTCTVTRTAGTSTGKARRTARSVLRLKTRMQLEVISQRQLASRHG